MAFVIAPIHAAEGKAVSDTAADPSAVYFAIAGHEVDDE